MPLVFAAIMPHGDELLPFTGADAGLHVLRRSMTSIGSALRRAEPDLLVLASPHQLRIPGHLAVVDTVFAEGRVASGDGLYERRLPLDRRFNRVLAEAASAAGLPPAAVGFQSSDGPLSTLPLDFGSLVPLFYLVGQGETPMLSLIGPPRDVGLVPLARLGREIARRCGDRRVAFVASADLAHTHRPDGPYGCSPAAAVYDRLVQAAVLAGELSRLQSLDSALLDAAKPDAPWQLAILAGALSGSVRVLDFAYARPTYFGMLAARFALR